MCFGATVTTNRGQGQIRDGMSGGSPSAKVRAEEQKPHRRLGRRASDGPDGHIPSDEIIDPRTTCCTRLCNSHTLYTKIKN
jgi:hypothetical protein